MYSSCVFRVSRFKDETEGFCSVAAGGPESFSLNTEMEVVYFGGKHILGVIFFFFIYFLKCYELDWRVETEKPNH